MPTAPTQQLLNLFYSYAHADEELRNELDKHLANLQHQGYIAPWHDRNISAGQEWEREIDEHLTSAYIIRFGVVGGRFVEGRVWWETWTGRGQGGRW